MIFDFDKSIFFVFPPKAKTYIYKIHLLVLCCIFYSLVPLGKMKFFSTHLMDPPEFHYFHQSWNSFSQQFFLNPRLLVIWVGSHLYGQISLGQVSHFIPFSSRFSDSVGAGWVITFRPWKDIATSIWVWKSCWSSPKVQSWSHLVCSKNGSWRVCSI